MLDAALTLARRTPTDPKTLARAARDHLHSDPRFAFGAGVLALEWIARGYGYEVTSADVWAAFGPAKQAAEAIGMEETLGAHVRSMVGEAGPGAAFIARVLRDPVDRP